jgi:hypothetical protein
MKKIKILLAFALGCLVTLIFARLEFSVSAQGNENPIVHVCVGADGVLRMVDPTATCPDGQRSMLLKRAEPDVDADKPKGNDQPSPIDQAKLDELNRRLKKLESMDCSSLGKSKVTAPFEVVDRSGKRIFYVNTGLAELYNSSGEDVAWMAASNSGGDFIARSTSGSLMTTFGASGQSSGLNITEGGNKRVDLGRNTDSGTYRLIFYNGGHAVAGIGEQRDGSGGSVGVDTSDGVIKAEMLVSKTTGRGVVWVSSAINKPVAQLTEGDHGGGLLVICGSGGQCNPPMVDAGDAGGYGLVRTGPMGFNPGVGLLGLPGSFIMGKK